MISLIKNEIYKIFKQKKLYIFAAVIAALTILQYVSYLVTHQIAEKNPDIKAAFANMNGQTMPLTMLGGLSTILVIFITILLSDIMTDEYKTGTLKLSLIRPVSRIKLLISKMFSVLIGSAVLLLFTMIISYIFGVIFFGWGDKFVFQGIKYSLNGDMSNYTVTYGVFKGILFTLFSYFIALVPYMAFGMVALFFATIFSNMGATIGTMLGIWVVLDIVRSALKAARPYVINTYFTYYMDFANNINWGNVLAEFGVILAYGIVFFAASAIIFRKKDILL
jgi:ABC-2 type transport system permease protein